ncbi:MAG: excalibur calcium-binding domain-containing protein [Rhodanobacteraceae bacterium]
MFKRIAVIVALVALAWQGYAAYRDHDVTIDELGNSPASFAPGAESGSGQSFSCDGRTRCTQMTSCEEATYFLENCPGVKMDGDNDGVPCEQQWCG